MRFGGVRASVSFIKIAAGACALFSAFSAAEARLWPQSGGWIISQLEDSCAMSMQFEGPGETTLDLLLYVDGRISLGLTNAGWSTHERQRYALRYVLNGTVYEGGDSVGARLDGRNGFITQMQSSFERDFAVGTSLRIYNGDTLVDQLSLAGTAAALATVRRCLAAVRSEVTAASRERQRWAHISPDPFAATPGSPPPAPVPSPRRAVFRSGIITNDDYPASAIRAGAHGTVEVRFVIGTEGRVTGCAVVASSGDASLDGTTCSLIQRRFRFQPAIGENGEAVTEVRTQRVLWSLPPEPAPLPVPTAVVELHPARHWVQIAGGDLELLEQQLRRLRAREPALLGRREAYVASSGAALRLLVGPFGSSQDAAAFLSLLSANRVTATVWDSVEGERVLPLPQWPRE